MTKVFNRTGQKTKRKALRKNMPLAEIILWKRLRGRQLNGYKFRRQYSIQHFVVDLYCPELKLAIEVDGDSHYTDDAAIADSERESYVESFGIEFLRFSNQEIYENIEGVLLRIAGRIKEITSEHQQITSEHQQITSEHQQITSEHQQITSEHQQITSPAPSLVRRGGKGGMIRSGETET